MLGPTLRLVGGRGFVVKTPFRDEDMTSSSLPRGVTIYSIPTLYARPIDIEIRTY